MLDPMDTPAAPQDEPCTTQCMYVTVQDGDDVAGWCIWCGHGEGEARFMLLRSGAPMPGKIIAVQIGHWPLMGKPELNWI